MHIIRENGQTAKTRLRKVQFRSSGDKYYVPIEYTAYYDNRDHFELPPSQFKSDIGNPFWQTRKFLNKAEGR